MPPKKKKTRLKPVARGFATTSVPKKVLPPSEPVDDAVGDTPNADSQSQVKESTSNVEAQQQPGAMSVSTGLGGEDLASQTLVDKFQEKTEKEISRYVHTFQHPDLVFMLGYVTD